MTDEVRIKEGFMGQKMLIIPDNIRASIKKNSLINTLYFTDIGYYPHAAHHYRERTRGVKQYILIYCVEGQGWIHMNTKKYRVTPNHYFIIPKDTPHRYGTIDEDSWSIYWVHFAGRQASLLFKKYAPSLVPEVVPIPFEERRINLFKDSLALLEGGYSMRNVEYANICLWQLLSSFTYHQYYEQTSPLNSFSDLVDQSVRYMKEHIDQPLKVEELASHFNYSASHYFAIFKKGTGYSPLHYFNQLKIQQACQYLSFTSLSVKEICFALGFQDPLYFSRIFKKMMGMSPTQYRSAYRT